MINSCVDFTLCILSSFWPSRCSHINRKRLSCGHRDKSVVLYLFSSFHKFHQQTLTNTTIVFLTRLPFATLSPLAVTERKVFKSISRAHSSRLSHFLQSHTLWFNQGRRESGEYGISWKRYVFDCFLVCRVTGKPSIKYSDSDHSDACEERSAGVLFSWNVVSLQWHVLVLCSQRCHSKCVSEATFYRLVQSFAVVLFE